MMQATIYLLLAAAYVPFVLKGRAMSSGSWTVPYIHIPVAR